MCHRHIPFIAILLAALLSVAADKTKEPAPSPEQIQQWVKQLGDDDFKVREEATKNLIDAGGAAVEAVRKATKSDDAEVKQRALMIIKQIGKQLEELEKAAIAYYEELGGKVRVDENCPGKLVIELHLYGTKFTDADLAQLKRFTKLQKLSLEDTEITNAGLVHLKGLTKLPALNLVNSKVTDTGLVHLKGLAKLQVLSLWKTKVTDAGLVHLKGLANLRTLNLALTNVPDTGLEHLKGLTDLQTLYLSSKVTDAGLVHLKGLANLQTLYLDSTNVTDAGLMQLKGLTSLKDLWLQDTKVTQAGIEKLQKSLPKCKIYTNFE